MNSKYFLIIFLTVGAIATIKSMQPQLQQPAANQPIDAFLLTTQMDISQAIRDEIQASLIQSRLTAMVQHQQQQLQQQYQTHQSDESAYDSEANDDSDIE